MKIVIAGCRHVTKEETIEEALRFYRNVIDKGEITEIVSGGARGVDTLAARYAHEHGINMVTFNADWNKHGKPAGVIRNKEMAKYGDVLLAIWDGESLGTMHMINSMNAERKPVYIYPVKPPE